MTRWIKLFAALLALGALAVAAGCEKRPTGFDPNPNAPEGTPSANSRLLAYRNAALRVLARDYASQNIDSVEVGAKAFAGDATMPLLLLLDGTPANSYELYRRDGGGKFQRTGDYTLQSATKYVNVGFEVFFGTDPTPGTYAPPTYLARGLVDGVASHASPLSNEGRLVFPDVQPITYNGDHQPFDSLFVVSWIGVPGATGYWIHIYEKPIPSGQRLLSSLPAPIAYVTAGDLFLGFRAGNNPGGSVQFRMGDTAGLFVLKSHAPLIGHDYLVRVTGVDTDGQVIAQTPGDLDSLSLSADLAFLAPPTYSAEKTKLFFSLGGTKVARRPPLHPVEGLSMDEARPYTQTLEYLVPQVRFPYIGPLRAATPARRARRR